MTTLGAHEIISLKQTDEQIGEQLNTYLDSLPVDIYSNIVPGMFQLAAKGLLNVPNQAEPLEKIEDEWNKKPEAGRRIVFTL